MSRALRRFARDYLDRAGFRVTTVGNGADALAVARTKRPDLIVLDLGLPQMDGLDCDAGAAQAVERADHHADGARGRERQAESASSWAPTIT